MNSAIASEVWVDDVLRRWKIAFAYFMEAYLVTTLYLLYGTNFREWDLLQFFSSTVVILWVPMRELFGVIESTLDSMCCRLVEKVFGPNWVMQLPFTVPTWLGKLGGMMGCKGIDWGSVSLNTVSSVILTDFVLSSYFMDQSYERMLSSASLVVVWVVIDDQPLLSSTNKLRPASGWSREISNFLSPFTTSTRMAPGPSSSTSSPGGCKQHPHPHIHPHAVTGVGPADSTGSSNTSSRSPSFSSFSSLSPPIGRLNPLLSLLGDAFNDGAALAFLTCVAPKLAAIPIAPLHSYAAGHCIAVFAMTVFSLLCAVDKIVTERLTLTLSMSAISSSSSVRYEQTDGGSDGGPEVRQTALPAPSSATSLYYRALSYIPFYYTWLSFKNSITAQALKADEGCCSLRDSPFISLLLSAATALVLLQAAVLSIIEPRRRLGFVLLALSGLVFVNYTKKILSQR